MAGRGFTPQLSHRPARVRHGHTQNNIQNHTVIYLEFIIDIVYEDQRAIKPIAFYHLRFGPIKTSDADVNPSE